MNRDTTLSMVGVPKAQRRQVETQYEGGIVKFVQDAVEAVFCKLPLADNYFWRVYMKGEYSRGCCPEYLKAENFELLKGGPGRAREHAHRLGAGLPRQAQRRRFREYVLLDHMDWLSDKFFPLLELEWQAILAPGRSRHADHLAERRPADRFPRPRQRHRRRPAAASCPSC